MKRVNFIRSRVLTYGVLLVAALAIGLLGSSVVDAGGNSTVHEDPVFELGDGVDPAVPGIGDILGSEQPGPDWGDLFNTDRSLKDSIDELGALQPNGVPDFLDSYGPVRARRDAAFIFDDISVGQMVDQTALSGAGQVAPGFVDPADDLGNIYAYSAFNADLDAVVYLGAERLSTADGDIVFQLGRQVGTLAQDGSILNVRTVGDLEVLASFSAGALYAVEVRSWELLDPANEIYGWATVETLPRNPSQSAEQCNQAGTLCAVCNGITVTAGDWPTYDAAGVEVDSLMPDSFLEIGINLTALLGFHTFENHYDSRYTHLQVFSAGDYAAGSFHRASQALLTAQSGS